MVTSFGRAASSPLLERNKIRKTPLTDEEYAGLRDIDMRNIDRESARELTNLALDYLQRKGMDAAVKGRAEELERIGIPKAESIPTLMAEAESLAYGTQRPEPKTVFAADGVMPLHEVAISLDSIPTIARPGDKMAETIVRWFGTLDGAVPAKHERKEPPRSKTHAGRVELRKERIEKRGDAALRNGNKKLDIEMEVMVRS